MSTYYRTEPMIKLQDIRDKCKITTLVKNTGASTPTEESFVDSQSGAYMHYSVTEDGYVCDYFRYGGNTVEDMLWELESIFEVRVISEYEEEYTTLHHEESNVIYLSLQSEE